MALVVVLWLIVLLSIMATGHSRGAHTETRLASRQVAMAEARADAEAAINHVVLAMLSERGLEIPVDGRVFAVAIDDRPVMLAVRQSTGLVDLNAGSAELLAAALEAAGMGEAERRETVDAILDWRDGDQLRHLNGIEDEDYAAAGLPWSSRDGAFAAVEELRYLPGIGADLYEKIAPLVTVYSGRGGIDIELAPPALVEAVAGDRIEPASTGGDGGGARSRSPRYGTFHIYATAGEGSGVRAAIEAVITTAGLQEAPVVLREWREPARQVVPTLTGVEG